MRLGVALALAGAIAVLAVPARADQRGWYVGGAGGWSRLNSLGSSSSSLDFDSSETNGFTVLGFAGYDFGGMFRAEGELGYRHHDVRSLTVVNDGGLGARLGTGSLTGASTDPTGTISALSFMINGIIDLLPHARVTPYIGGGFGAARLSLNKLGVAGTTIADGSDTRPAGQGIAGIAAHLTPRVTLGLDYRYFLTVNPSFNDSSGESFHSKFREQDLLLVVTYHFGAPPPPPPAPAAVAAPPPPPPPLPSPLPPPVAAAPPPHFLVFFDFDKANLTPSGAAVVQRAAAAYTSAGGARIDVTGYSDLAGPQAYNLVLSRRRADTVRRYLVKLGVPDSAIVEQARGKADPRVPTPDGVPNPENRRVEIGELAPASSSAAAPAIAQ